MKNKLKKITPMLHSVKFYYENFGTTGNISLVRQNLKLSIILPNPPITCKYVYTQSKFRNRGQGNNNTFSIKLDRRKI